MSALQILIIPLLLIGTANISYAQCEHLQSTLNSLDELLAYVATSHADTPQEIEHKITSLLTKIMHEAVRAINEQKILTHASEEELASYVESLLHRLEAELKPLILQAALHTRAKEHEEAIATLNEQLDEKDKKDLQQIASHITTILGNVLSICLNAKAKNNPQGIVDGVTGTVNGIANLVMHVIHRR